MDFILEGLYDSVKDKVGKRSSAKELWDKLHDIYSSPITDSENGKEDVGIEQEERCSSCQTDSEEEEYVINRSIVFCFNCEKRGHIEIECSKIYETKKTIEIKYIYEEKLISALDELKKEREENKSLKKELMKQKESVQGSEEA
jgi:hypothetical protein